MAASVVTNSRMGVSSPPPHARRAKSICSFQREDRRIRGLQSKRAVDQVGGQRPPATAFTRRRRANLRDPQRPGSSSGSMAKSKMAACRRRKPKRSGPPSPVGDELQIARGTRSGKTTIVNTIPSKTASAQDPGIFSRTLRAAMLGSRQGRGAAGH